MASTNESTHADLLDVAREVRERSYAPFSKFKAGAAVRCEGGEVVGGVIVENVSLGLAMCAERVAMFSAVTQGLQPTALGLVAPATSGELTWPCGACLQVALELGGPEMEVTVGNIDATKQAHSRLGDLIPRGPKVDTDD